LSTTFLKSLQHLAAKLCSVLLITGCSNTTKSDRDHLVFRYNEHSNITSLDPAFAKDQRNIWACHQLYNGLTQLDAALQVQPDIAKSWTVSDDGLHYTFALRDDIYFHKSELFGTDSTRVVTAYDFEYSLHRLSDPKIASPGAWILQNVAQVTAVEQHKLHIALKKPFPAFLGLLSMKFCAVVPKEVVTAYGTDFRSHPIGTGPFQFKHWEENIKLVFRKNKHYHEKDSNGNALPYLEAIAITFLPDKQSELLQFVQGNIDVLNSIDPSYKDELLTPTGLLRKKYQPTISMIVGPYLNTEYLGLYLDSKTPELQSQELRQAINYGFDREKMITYLRNGIGTPATHGFIPKGLPGFHAMKGYTYQPKKAKELMREYQQKSGDQQPLDIFRSSWIADYPDAENYLSLFYSKNFAPGGPNYTHFKNERYDQWYEDAMLETAPQQRIALYQKMDSLLMDAAPMIPLYYDQVVRFTQKNVQGLDIDAINTLDLRKVHKTPKR